MYVEEESDQHIMDARTLIANLLAEGEANRELQRTDPQAYRKKMESELPENDCCLCRAHFRGHGNNPEPIVDHGVACDECDRKLVMVARLRSACGARQ